jgi:GNAT superfamily N-acetyltransferase
VLRGSKHTKKKIIDLKTYKPNAFVLEVRDIKKPENLSPITWLLVERSMVNVHDDNGVLLNAHISIKCQPIAGIERREEFRITEFCGGYSQGLTDTVSLTSKSVTNGGYVVLEDSELLGQRIGTFMMNEIVRWAKQWPKATIRSIELDAGHAHGENRERRNRFYEQFGLQFDYADTERIKGYSRPMMASQLVLAEEQKMRNITVHSLAEFLGKMQIENENLLLEFQRVDGLAKERLADLKTANAGPIAWALKTLFMRWLPI